MSVRLGYACINTGLNKKFPVNRTMRLATYKSNGVEYAIQLAKSNLDSVLEILKCNEANGIKFYRLSSDMFPHVGNPKCGAKLEDKIPIFSYETNCFNTRLHKIGKYAYSHGHRLTMHPGQFNQIGSPSTSVFEKTVVDLAYHATILDEIGLGNDSVMIVHGGGVYGDKQKTMDRWCKQFKGLPFNVQDRLVLENCEKCYSTEDVLKICEALNIPMVFDTHHYECYGILHPDEKQQTISKLVPRIERTWSRRDIQMKMHISEQDISKRIGAHSNYVYKLPWDVIDYTSIRDIPLDIMVEAKEKEKAVQLLYDKYFDVDKNLLHLGTK